MRYFDTVADLQDHLDHLRDRRVPVAFVPTMGALHAGHLSLIRSAKRDYPVAVCSIFVNPTQFGEAADLEHYPRTVRRDLDVLSQVHTDVAFVPPGAEIYPPDSTVAIPDVPLDGLDQHMEGAHRPGHFGGVMQVVNRLLHIVQPDALYMGQKDYQQFRIIEHMVEHLDLPTEVVMCPTVRDTDGLALSSRNLRLDAQQRRQAKLIYATLRRTQQAFPHLPPERLCNDALRHLNRPGFEPEYFEIVDGDTLQPIAQYDGHDRIVACTAVRVGEVRLIDNVLLRF